MSLSVQVSRTLLSLGALELNHASRSRRIMPGGVGPGEAKFRRDTVSSPVVPGRILLTAVPDVQTLMVKVRHAGSSHAELAARVAESIAAFTQDYYSLTVTLGGEQNAWLCEPADYSVGEAGQLTEVEYRALVQDVTFEVTRSPIPLAGAY